MWHFVLTPSPPPSVWRIIWMAPYLKLQLINYGTIDEHIFYIFLFSNISLREIFFKDFFSHNAKIFFVLRIWNKNVSLIVFDWWYLKKNTVKKTIWQKH